MRNKQNTVHLNRQKFRTHKEKKKRDREGFNLRFNFFHSLHCVHFLILLLVFFRFLYYFILLCIWFLPFFVAYICSCTTRFLRPRKICNTKLQIQSINNQVHERCFNNNFWFKRKGTGFCLFY